MGVGVAVNVREQVVFLAGHAGEQCLLCSAVVFAYIEHH